MFALISRMLRLSGRYKKRIQLAFVCAFVEQILSKMPIFFAFLVLAGFASGTMSGARCLAVGAILVCVVVLQAVVHYASDRLQSAAGYMIFADQRIALADHLRRLPMGYFTAGNIGKISSVLSSDMVFVEEVAMSTIANMMSYLLSAGVLIVFMFWLDWRLGLIALAVMLLANVVARRMNAVSLKEAAARQEQGERLTDAVLSFVEGIGVIKSYNLLGAQSAALTENFARSRDVNAAFERRMTPWTTGLSILYGEATRLTVMNAALDRTCDVLVETELPDTGTAHLPETTVGDEIVFENVSFSYDGKNDVLHDISFAMPPRTMTALVGPSGGGKSTIANLLARFWDVGTGCVKIRGVDIRDVPLAELMDQISMVFQRVYLFQDTIYNNIAMGRPDASEKEIIQAAKKARCYDFVTALPDGFQTIVGEGGATLSGGERQRIAIARCILKDAPIVILDEATASVDVDNERYIQEAISELVRGKTLLVIAHRLHTIRDADQILVVAGGRIAQRGDHASLSDQPGIYQDFVQKRSGGSRHESV